MGCYASFGANKDQLQDLLLFHSAKEEKPVTLREYVEKMPEGQPYIYYAAGESMALLAKLPAAERVLDKGYDVLFLTDDVDEFALQMMRDYDKKEFHNVSGSDLGLESEDEKKALEEKNEANKPLFDAMKEALGDKVDAVRLSGRLKNHPVCLSSEGALSHRDGKGIKQHAHAGKGEQPQGAGGERRAPRVRRAGKGAAGRR